jgi:cyanate permease
MIGAPLFAGYMFDTTGSYFVPFITFAAISFSGAVLMLFAQKPKAVAVAGQQP